jgi:hypothetical protein
MPQDYQDYNSAVGGLEGQVAPTVNTFAGQVTQFRGTGAANQVSTQSNPFPGINAAITAGVVAVTPFTSSTPGGKAGAQ